MKTKLLAICLLLVTSQVYAEELFDWTLISTDSEGYKWYGHKDSIRKNKSENYIVWIILNNNNKERNLFYS